MKNAVLLLAALAAALPAAAQIRRQPASQPGATVEVALTTGSSSYAANGPGQCRSAPAASIHGVAASLYSVSQSQGGKTFNLTVWKPKDGSREMVRLSLADGARRTELDTVAKPAQGSATVKMDGTTFAIEGTTAKGEKLSAKVHCSGFAPLHAEGG